MKGRVLGLAKQPLINVKVTLNDVIATTTGEEGTYVVDIEGSGYVGIDDEYNYFHKIKVSSSQQSDEIPDLVSHSIGLCGSIKMFDQNLQLRLITSENDSFKRRINMQQLPNPIENETWDTPGINETLHETESTFIDDKGRFCFKALAGLWRLWPELSEDEQASGVIMDQHDLKCFVQNAGIGHLSM